MDNLKYWLALSNVPGLWPSDYARLLARFSNAQRISAACPSELESCGLKPQEIAALQKPDMALIAQQHRWADQPNHHILTLDHPDYPPLLKTIADPPPVLFVKGQVSFLSQPQLAMIGSRRPSFSGVETARAFSKVLAQEGLTITSGLASGIDTASHKGALEIGGKTIAVLGSGLEHIYPACNRALADEIAAQGALVSEFPLETSPIARHFPRRNRIISGLSLGVLVVEATLKSGSLITARLAGEQGREVFAIPGSIHNPLAEGCHALIQQGAKLVAAIPDILTEFKHGLSQCCTIPAAIPSRSEAPLDSDDRKLLECIGFEPVSVDQIVQRAGWPAAQVTARLVALELWGYVCVTARGYERSGKKRSVDVIADDSRCDAMVNRFNRGAD